MDTDELLVTVAALGAVYYLYTKKGNMFPPGNGGGNGDDYHPSGYTLKWSDEFDSNSIGTNWHIDTVFNVGNATSVNNGSLHLKFDYSGSTKTAAGYVQSGSSMSNIKFFGPFGYFAVRCKIARKINLHNQWWFTSSGWHDEVDYELTQNRVSGGIRDRIDFAMCHNSSASCGSGGWCNGIVDKPGIKDDNWHVLGWLWTPNSYTWYIDGNQVGTTTGCICQQAMGLRFGLCGSLSLSCEVHGVKNKLEDTSGLPKYWDIDYVRFYQQ